jgi:O-antigen/teichoic acid export membrane protein
MFLSSVLAFLLTQTDKLIVGSHTSLADFGIYMLAATAAAGLLQFVQPMNVAILPRFTALVETGNREELASAFHVCSQWLALIVLPVGLLVVAMPQHAMLAWTGQVGVASAGAPILSLLMLASVVNALANVPYMLQLAHGWTSLSNKMNIAGMSALLPVMIWATNAVGGIGAAATLVGLNLLSLTITSSLVLTRLLPGHWWRWARNAIAAPVLCGASVALGMHFALPRPDARIAAIIDLIAAGLAVGLTVLAVLPYPRKNVLSVFRRRRQ